MSIAGSNSSSAMSGWAALPADAAGPGWWGGRLHVRALGERVVLKHTGKSSKVRDRIYARNR